MTTPIKIRPFKPIYEKVRDPYAVLRYGNIEIELDYTILTTLKIDNKSDCFHKSTSMANAAFKEIVREMDYDHSGVLNNHHRDGRRGGVNSLFSHNPLHPDNEGVELLSLEDDQK